MTIPQNLVQQKTHQADRFYQVFLISKNCLYQLNRFSISIHLRLNKNCLTLQANWRRVAISSSDKWCSISIMNSSQSKQSISSSSAATWAAVQFGCSRKHSIILFSFSVSNILLMYLIKGPMWSASCLECNDKWIVDKVVQLINIPSIKIEW